MIINILWIIAGLAVILYFKFSVLPYVVLKYNVWIMTKRINKFLKNHPEIGEETRDKIKEDLIKLNKNIKL